MSAKRRKQQTMSSVFYRTHFQIDPELKTIRNQIKIISELYIYIYDFVMIGISTKQKYF